MVSGYAPQEVRSLKCQALEQTQIYARTKVEEEGGCVHLGSERPVERECCTPQFLPAGCYRG